MTAVEQSVDPVALRFWMRVAEILYGKLTAARQEIDPPRAASETT